MKNKFVIIFLNLFFIFFNNITFASSNPSESSQKYKLLLKKISDLKKRYIDKLEEYKLATGRNKENLQLEVDKIREEGKSLAVRIKEIKKANTIQSIPELQKKLNEAKIALSATQKEIEKLKEWSYKVGGMSRVVTENVCAWCGAHFPKKATRCPGCGRTSVSRVWSNEASDVDKEVSLIHKKERELFKKLLIQRSRFIYYKNKLRNSINLSKK